MNTNKKEYNAPEVRVVEMLPATFTMQSVQSGLEDFQDNPLLGVGIPIL